VFVVIGASTAAGFDICHPDHGRFSDVARADGDRTRNAIATPRLRMAEMAAMSRRHLAAALALLCTAQFLLQLDFSIVNVALATVVLVVTQLPAPACERELVRQRRGVQTHGGGS
jgi:hypothetical protein